MISSLVVFGLMGPEFENVKESWFLIMLFTDIPKVTRMAQFALTSSLQRRIPANVAVSCLKSPHYHIHHHHYPGRHGSARARHDV